MANNNWEVFFENTLELLDFLSTANSSNEIEVGKTRLELVITAIAHVIPRLTNGPCKDFITELYNNCIQLNIHFGHGIESILAPPSYPANIIPFSTFIYSGCSGKPKINISKDLLAGIRELGHSWTTIAKMLMVSKWTILRRVREFDLHHLSRYTAISDEELTNTIQSFIQMHGNFVGYSLVKGHLKSIGIHVQQRRVRTILRNLDPESSCFRWAIVVSRRSYNVRSSNSLWHIDGHHSLISWKFVIHGAIDGFSRLITLLHCSTNNRSETVLDLFDNAVIQYGTPSRIRTDYGGENVLIWQRMEELRGRDRGSALRGTSQQNQRIERLWRDVFRCVCCNFYYLFHTLETQNILDRNDNLHLCILHYVFLPRINLCLKSFCDAWNSHPIRTEHNWSPERIWQNGMMSIHNRHLNTVQSLVNVDNEEAVEDLEWFGYDPDVPFPAEDLSMVEVEDIHIEDQLLQTLEEHINPLEQSDSMGIDIYVRALNLLN